jgi:hypothetical protein
MRSHLQYLLHVHARTEDACARRRHVEIYYLAESVPVHLLSLGNFEMSRREQATNLDLCRPFGNGAPPLTLREAQSRVPPARLPSCHAMLSREEKPRKSEA